MNSSPMHDGITLIDGGITISWGLVATAIGGAIALVAVYAWSFEPVNEPDEGH